MVPLAEDTIGSHVGPARPFEEHASEKLVKVRPRIVIVTMHFKPGVELLKDRDHQLHGGPRAGSERIAAFVGDPDDRIEGPTPAQRMLFGEWRRRVPRWFDLDRPVAHALSPRGAEAAAAAAGRGAFFDDHFDALAAGSFGELSALTGRDLSPVAGEGLERARSVVVA